MGDEEHLSTDDLFSLVPCRLQGRVGPLVISLVVANKWIRVVLFEIAQRMIDATMDRFISLDGVLVVCLIKAIEKANPDVQDQVSHGSLALGHIPVGNSKLRNLEIGIGPLGQVSLLNFLETARVCVDGLLLEIADKAMRDLWRDQVADEHGVEEHTLSADDDSLHEPSRLRHLHECQEVHPLIVRLFEERFDPAIIPLHTPQT